MRPTVSFALVASLIGLLTVLAAPTNAFAADKCFQYSGSGHEYGQSAGVCVAAGAETIPYATVFVHGAAYNDGEETPYYVDFMADVVIAGEGRVVVCYSDGWFPVCPVITVWQ